MQNNPPCYSVKRTASEKLVIRWLRILGLALVLSCLSGSFPFAGDHVLFPVMRAQANPNLTMRRFLLSVGANRGSGQRLKLQYATADARAMRDVLSQLGGVSADDALLIDEPTSSRLSAAFQLMKSRIAAVQVKGMRTELVFYYSGHSDETGLLLGEESVTYIALRGMLQAVGADVRIAILDSCASGAITRTKGGVWRAPFLYDASTEVRGHAFLTSSSSDEAAQESDRIRGSFFTHYLVSGLRGAADESGDRRVTLTEAYRFAFNETLARTGQTQAGAQHPNYDIALAGTGDLVITDLRKPNSELELDRELEGRLFVRDARGQLVAELYKPGKRSVRLAVPDGRHDLMLVQGKATYLAEVQVKRGAASRVAPSDFERVKRESTQSRGEQPLRYVRRPFAAALIPPFTSNRRHAGEGIINHFGMTLLYDDPDVLTGLQIAVAGNGVRERADGIQIAGIFNQATYLRGLQLSLLFRYADVFYGAQLGLGPNVVIEHGYGVQLGPINWARRIDGSQLGLLNMAGEVRGVQVGLVNATSGRVRGLQLGLLNYADEADVSLAPIGITRKGGVHAQLSTGDTALSTFALRLDSNYNYTFIAFGWHPLGNEVHRSYSLGAGLGAKIPAFRSLLFVDFDLGVHLVQRLGTLNDSPSVLPQIRAMLRVELHKHFSLFAGPTFNFLVQTDSDLRVRPGFSTHTYFATPRNDEIRAAYWPGWVFGIRL